MLKVRGPASLNEFGVNIEQRKQNAVLGAFVADAATLGFHWLYDADRIAELAGDSPEFHEPNPLEYQGVAGYFAAEGKRAGDLSHYGVQLETALTSLFQCGGQWNRFHYQSVFCQTFDRGGSFRGYIDGATAGTLDRLHNGNRELIDSPVKKAGELTTNQIDFLHKYLPKKGALCSGADLEKTVMDMAGLMYKDEAVLTAMRSVVRHYDENRSALGADDDQLPAISKLPVVVARFAGADDFEQVVEQAIRVTNDNDDAVLYGCYAAKVLEGVIQGTSIGEALKTNLDLLTSRPKASQKMSKALDYELHSLPDLGKTFGPACSVSSGIPVATAILKEEPSFVSGVRNNILVGGDNCGRSIWLGALLGAHHGLGGEQGVPFSWLARFRRCREILPMLDAI